MGHYTALPEGLSDMSVEADLQLLSCSSATVTLCVRVCGRGNCLLCSKIAEAEAAVSVNEKKWLVMHMHVQLKLDELRGPPTLGSL